VQNRKDSRHRNVWTSSSEDKLARVRELGLQHGINYKQRDYVEAIKDLTRGERGRCGFRNAGRRTRRQKRQMRSRLRTRHRLRRCHRRNSATRHRLLYAKGASVHGLWLSYLSANRPLMEAAWKQLSAWLAAGKLNPWSGKSSPGAGPRSLHPDAGRQELRQIVLKIRFGISFSPIMRHT